MKKIFTPVIFVTCISCSWGHRSFTSQRFNQQTSQHKKIAILPPKIILTGNQPNQYNELEIDRLEIGESKLFQQALFNNLLMSSNKHRRALLVELQPFETTLSLLEKNKIDVRKCWDLDDIELSRILGVDALVRTTIQKERIMSDVAAAGIFTAGQIVNAISKDPAIVPVYSRTSSINATCSIVSNNQTLWNDSYVSSSSFMVPANQVIQNITIAFARHFPYIKRA